MFSNVNTSLSRFGLAAKAPVLLLILVSLLLLNACASNSLSKVERKQLSTIEIQPTTEIEAAFKGIDVVKEQPGGIGTLKLSPNVGSFVASNVMTGLRQQMQMLESEESEGQHFEAIIAQFPERLRQAVENILISGLTTNTFFENRIVQESENQFSSTLWDVALRHIYEKNGVMQYAFQVKVYAEISGPADEVYHRFNLEGESDVASLQELAEDPALLKTAVEQALAALNAQFLRELNEMTELESQRS